MGQITLQPTISNELTAELPALYFEGRVVIVDSEEQIEAACDDLLSHPMIGFDTETRPSFKAGVSYKVSLLQLSTPTTCYLFRLNKIPLSKPIMSVLESKTCIKVGADVAGDIRSLNQLRHFRDRGFLDLQNIIWEWGVNEKSLRKMSALTLGKRISKAQRLSNWEAVALTPQQQQYAATDAWACTEIYDKLLTIDKLSKEEIAKIREEQALRAAEAAAKKAAKKQQWESRVKARKSETKAEESKDGEQKPSRGKNFWRRRKSTNKSKEQ